MYDADVRLMSGDRMLAHCGFPVGSVPPLGHDQGAVSDGDTKATIIILTTPKIQVSFGLEWSWPIPPPRVQLIFSDPASNKVAVQ